MDETARERYTECNENFTDLNELVIRGVHLIYLPLFGYTLYTCGSKIIRLNKCLMYSWLIECIMRFCLANLQYYGEKTWLKDHGEIWIF